MKDSKRRVLVVGAGGTGLVAAVQAAECGASVVILERESSVGGITATATGLIRGSETWLQKKLGINDSRQAEYEEFWETSLHTADPSLLGRLVANSATAHEWLRRLGLSFKEDSMAVGPRTALILPNGSGLTDTLYDVAKRLGVKFMMQHKATHLLVKEGEVIGVRAQSFDGEVDFKPFDAVILCSGGTWGPQDLLEKSLDPVYKGIIMEWGSKIGGKGDGLNMAKEVGAAAIDLHYMNTNPAIMLNDDLRPLALISSSMRDTGGAIFLNQALHRFVNEDLTYSILAFETAKELQKRGENWFWELWDARCLDIVPAARDYLAQYGGRGLRKGDSIEDLAKRMGVDPIKLHQAVAKYNSFFTRSKEPQYGRLVERLHPLEKSPFFSVKVGIGCSHSLGGIRINTQAQVLREDGRTIPNLFAAGDEIGGCFGRGYRAGANYERLVVFGRIAGENAARGDLGAAERQEFTA